MTKKKSRVGDGSYLHPFASLERNTDLGGFPVGKFWKFGFACLQFCS